MCKTRHTGKFNNVILSSQVDKAWTVYKESQEKKIPLSVRGYNAVISLVPIMSEGDEKPRTLTRDVYQAMVANGITPNIQTFNAALNVAAALKSNWMAIDFIRNILADIRQFQLKPSLTTYYYVLRVINRFGNCAMLFFLVVSQRIVAHGSLR